MRDNSKHAEDKTKAVEERRRAAEDVKGGEVHAVADEAGVIDQIAGQIVSESLRASGHTGE